MIGRYHQAHLQIRSLDDLIQDKFVDAFHDGRRKMVQGWIGLAVEEYAEARLHFDQSIKCYKKTASSIEWIAWAQAGLASAYMLQNQWDIAYPILRQALKTSIDIKGFIPLLFTLPFACYYLAQEYPNQARDVFDQIQTSRFLSNSQFFKDTVYRHLPDEIKHTESKEDSYPSESDLIQNLWETASKVMSLWEAE